MLEARTLCPFDSSTLERDKNMKFKWQGHVKVLYDMLLLPGNSPYSVPVSSCAYSTSTVAAEYAFHPFTGSMAFLNLLCCFIWRVISGKIRALVFVHDFS